MLVKARLALLILLFTLSLNAKFLFNDYLVSPKAANLIEKIGNELYSKTKVNAYLIATHDKLKRGVSVYDYLKKYQSSMSKPYAAIVFVPNSQRIHLVASNKELLIGLNKDTILDYAIKIIASKDSNSLQSKYDVGLVQAYSELADEIASIKGVKLKSTIKEGGRTILTIINTIIIIGSIIVIWIFFIYPILKRKKS
jgi:hypothetical protein